MNNTVKYIKLEKPLEACIFDNEKKERKVSLCDVIVCEGSIRQAGRTFLGCQTLSVSHSIKERYPNVIYTGPGTFGRVHAAIGGSSIMNCPEIVGGSFFLRTRSPCE